MNNMLVWGSLQFGCCDVFLSAYAEIITKIDIPFMSVVILASMVDYMFVLS